MVHCVQQGILSTYLHIFDHLGRDDRCTLGSATSTADRTLQGGGITAAFQQRIGYATSTFEIRFCICISCTVSIVLIGAQNEFLVPDVSYIHVSKQIEGKRHDCIVNGLISSNGSYVRCVLIRLHSVPVTVVASMRNL